MRLAIASGKGGTGKTFVATNLAWTLDSLGCEVTYVDADVEEPNGHFFLQPRRREEVRYKVQVPALRDGTCSGCGACQEACAFNAIISLKDRVMVFPELCHSCGACLLVCQERALIEVPREVGTITRAWSGDIRFFSGLLDIGEVRAPALIEGVMTMLSADPEGAGRLALLDSPPGTSCSAMSVVRQADLVLLVTEPTIFGLHDLELAVAMCHALDKPVVAVINRADLGGPETRAWLDQQGISVILEIPFSREIAMAYVDGEIATQRSPELRADFERLAQAIREGVR